MFIVACRLPFNIVSHVYFNCMIQQAARSSTISIPTRQKVRDRILELSQLRHAEELSRIPADSKVSLALDCWTSPQRKAFLALTGYYINANFESKEVLLGFEPISGSHNGIRLANCVLGVLEDAKLDCRVLAITTDNASNNTTLMENLSKKLRQGIDSSSHVSTRILDPEVQKLCSIPTHIPCLAHVIQLSVQSLLQQIKVNAHNDDTEIIWEEEVDTCLAAKQELPLTLEKVSHIFPAIYSN
jgi:hypothetical protein